MANPYDTLGVPKNASADEIKKAYRKLAREHHPDASGGDESRFKEIQGAYDLLSDPEKRQAYDTFGATNGRPAAGGGGGGGPQFADFDLSDLFGGIFGGGGAPARPRAGARRRRRGAHDALVRRRAPRRRGADPGRARDGLPDVRRHRRRAGDGADRLPAVRRPRRRVRLAGAVLALAPVPAVPRQRHDRRAPLHDLPRLRPRADDEELQRQDPARDQGPAPASASPARARQDGTAARPATSSSSSACSRRETYTRRGDDLIVDVPVGYADAALGASVDVPDAGRPDLAEGPGRLAARQAAQGQGPRRAEAQGGGKGDLLARVKLTVPEKVSKQERELLEQLRKVSR